ncbi:MAG TPA: family 78 glycoside hydrolase catalytic domain [Dongiaceae bacterium]|nr:family 78 glycoside hydrolase catalytic domain [Dongiaceae bacterium]
MAAQKPWTAQWITAPEAPERDFVVLHFRKVIELSQAPKEFRIDVSADNQFLLCVNGQEAGRGPSRDDLGHWRYETLDISAFLHSGQNFLSATVWHYGTRAAVAQISERAGFLVHGHSDAERAADTDATWEVEQEHGLTIARPKMRDYFAAEPEERLDGAAWDWGWTEAPGARTPNSPWTHALTLGRGARKGQSDPPNNWQLLPDGLPPMERSAAASGRLVRATGISPAPAFPEHGITIPANSRVSLLLDRGDLVTGFPVLAVRGGSGGSVRLTYAEALLDEKGQKGNRNETAGKHIEGVSDEFVSGGGETPREFSPLGWRTWRFLQIDVETKAQPLQLDSLQTWFSAYPFIEKARFASDDESLAPIWKIGWRTARLDAHDTYMDTPYWERLQYIGDTRIQALISYSVSGDDRLARQAIDAFNHSRVPEGITQSRYPSSLVQMIPSFSLLWVGMVHDFWMYRGDEKFVREQLPGTRTVLNWFVRRQRPDGLLGRIPWWPFLDWGQDFSGGVPPQDADGGSASLTLQFVEALQYAAELEEKFGDKTLAAEYRDAAAHAGYAVWKLCWSEKEQLLADTPAQSHFSQHANILAIWLDVIPARRQKDLLTRILSASDPGFSASGPALPPMTTATYYFRFYLARALEHAGMGEEYLQLLGPWRQMVALGLSTWAESPEPTRSDSHAWSAHPNYDLLTIVAGIHPAKPGFAEIAIEPHLGGLKHVQAAMPIPQGLVEVEYTREGDGLVARIKLPENAAGSFVWRGKSHALHSGDQTIR